jgi:HEPN domain-containing protein
MPESEGHDLARALLRRAGDDALLVRRVLDDLDIADAIVGFHAQQAVEKAIKAVLAVREIDFVQTHALGYLIELVESNGIEAPAALAEADVLGPWAVDFRYETESEPPLDRRAAMVLVDVLLRWAAQEVAADSAS